MYAPCLASLLIQMIEYLGIRFLQPLLDPSFFLVRFMLFGRFRCAKFYLGVLKLLL